MGEFKIVEQLDSDAFEIDRRMKNVRYYNPDLLQQKSTERVIQSDKR
jgi:hypothetical protein